MSIKTYPTSELPNGLADKAGFVIKAAFEAQKMAYAPYSKFNVGCAVMTVDGSIFKGCNVETANYDGSHAEEIALGAMVMAGRLDAVLCACVAALDGRRPNVVMSCGKCRQALKEFSSLQGREIYLLADAGAVEGDWAWAKLSDLLPESFGPADIGVDLAKYRR